MVIERFDIVEFTRLRIEQAADEVKPKKPRQVVRIEPLRPERDTQTDHMVYTYLNER